MGTELFTIGHSNVPIERLIELLRRHEIALLVDVRSTPYSRHNPQFNREGLARALQDAGIEYLYAGQYLGGRPADPACYQDGQVRYELLQAQPWFQNALTGLQDLAAGRRTAVMCAEEDPQRCHRQHLLTPPLLARGIAVRHIRGDGRVEEAHPPAPQPRQLTLW